MEDDEASEIMARKKRVRAAHRGSVTKMIGRLNDALGSSDVCRLKQLKQSLTDKLSVLSKLDDELIELVGEEQLEAEVEQADLIREDISLAVISIDDALNALVAPTRRTKRGTRKGHVQEEANLSQSSESSEGEEHSATPHDPPIGSDSHAGTETTSSASDLPHTTATHSAPSSNPPPVYSTPPITAVPLPTSSFPSISSLRPALPHSAAPTIAAVPTSPWLPFATPSGPLPLGTPSRHGEPHSFVVSSVPLPSVTSTYPSVVASHMPPLFDPLMMPGVMAPHLPPPLAPPVMPRPPFTYGIVPQVKLPKLSIKRFNGDLTRWVTFWDSFNSSIHTNPTLSSVDKFSYLISLLESSAAEAIAGLTLTAANYDEAIATLKKRFGNSQLIVNRHMEALLSIAAIPSHHDIKGLRKLHDSVETHIRGLRALGVPAETYGGLLTSVLVNKLPPELRLIVSREMTGEKWDLDRVMKIFEQEVDARERASISSAPSKFPRAQPRIPTAATLVASNSVLNSGNVSCVYCGQGHMSNSCAAVVDVATRKEILRRAGRCYTCLRKHHLSKDCRSNLTCKKCRGRHHVTICTRRTGQTSIVPAPPASAQGSSNETSSVDINVPRSTSSLYAGTRTPILLQTAQLQLFNPNSGRPRAVARAIMDSGSQRSYITCSLRNELNLPTLKTESLQIKTFGSKESYDSMCDVVQLGLDTRDHGTLKIKALVVPFICNPLTSQPINHSKESYDHLSGLDLADAAGASEVLEVDVLIGSDSYWDLATGRVIRGGSGPTAIHTKVGWVLSGPANRQEVAVNLTFTSTHTLKVDILLPEPTLDDRLKQFWELESLGVMRDETSVYDKFVQQIRFDGRRYEVSLPWKEHHPPLPDHLELCRKRLTSLIKRLRQTPQLLAEYNTIIQDQLDKGMVEAVAQPMLTDSDQVHYIPHHGVVRQDKATSKLRIVYDASARSTGPSLNDCLYTGPKFGQSIFDILLRFRLHQVALTGDIEKAFHMVSVQERDRDALRFLWVADPSVEPPEMVTLRFTRVVFGVSSSPFLLNATINHHMETHRGSDPAFVDKFLSSIYVDDLVSGSSDLESTHELYLKSKLRLAAAGFKLRKFVTNSDELHRRIQESESPPVDGGAGEPAHAEDDQSYAKDSLGAKTEEKQGINKVLGVQWNDTQDEFQFDIGDVAHTMEGSEPTKRSVVSVTARFFDPLGVVSPVTILFKIFCQQLCEAKVGWDEPLSGCLLEKWDQLLLMLKGAKAVTIPRCLYRDVSRPLQSARLVGFCDASTKAYAAVVYMRFESEARVDVKFLATKTRVAPVGGITIPRLELLSAVLLSKLITSIRAALEPELSLDDHVCFTDSKVSLYWIQGVNHEWKQFVENRVATIRRLVQPQNWRHCPGRENPADIPSRGMSVSALTETPIWLQGPDWLHSKEGPPEESDVYTSELQVPDDCRSEMKRKELTHSLVTVENKGHEESCLSRLINPERYGSSHRLFRVTALVLKFIRCLRRRVDSAESSTPSDAPLSPSDLDQAKLYWIKDLQSHMKRDGRFPAWRHQLGLFVDESGVWRCGGRMSNSCLSPAAQTPILLDKKHHLAALIVMDAHKRVMHNGVKETLTELRSTYWLVRGRQFVRKLIHDCVICRKLEGKHCQGIPPPPLPEYRVQQSRPFQTTGVDFAGPLHVKTSDAAGTSKAWLCLYTCCTTRALHLDLVPDMTATTFMNSFRRFTARRGTPNRMISDNAKTFKSAATIVKNILESSEAKKFFSNLHVEWQFNLERAPWWGGIFERMIKSAKRCLKKAIGKNCLTYDELLTLVIEVEAVLNSRPLTYVSSEDVEEPLTPSHLLVGYRILTLPDPSVPDDPDYSPENVTRRMSHLAKTLGNFWKRWKKEYLLELREFHRTRVEKGIAYTIKKGEVVTVYDEGHPRGLWRLGKVEDLIQSSDGKVRGVYVKVMSKKGRTKVLRRPIQHIYPLEIHSNSQGSDLTVSKTPPVSDGHPQDVTEGTGSAPNDTPRRPVRTAAIQARDRVLGCMMDD